jgi:hypothetical protein
MATNLPYDLQALQDRINTLVNNDNDTPADGDDEWLTRLNLIYQAIGNWEAQDVLWNELWTTYTHGSTLSAATTYVITATDFRFPGGYIRLTLNGATSYIPIIKPSQAQSNIDVSRQAAYFTGNNNAGWTLNLTWTPASGDGTFGATLAFDYYKYAFKPATAAQKPEMSDPNYIVYWVAGQQNLLEGNNNQYSVYDAQSLECLDNMRIMNDLLPDYQDNRVEDVDALHGAVLGE